MRTTDASVAINGPEVREIRKVNGDSGKGFALKAGISQQYVSKIERGERPFVSPPVFGRICDALGVPKAKRRSLIVSDHATNAAQKSAA